MACGGKKAEEGHDHDHQHDHHAGDSAAASQEEWKAMDDFHMLMAESFHPYKDSANLAPAKEKAVELATAAETWANAPLPEKVRTDEMKAKLETLKTDAQAFAATAKTTNDKAIGEALTNLHDEFHAIQEMWYGGKGAHHEH
jgi:hypothetical protein